jgi:hypothetical protein
LDGAAAVAYTGSAQDEAKMNRRSRRRMLLVLLPILAVTSGCASRSPAVRDQPHLTLPQARRIPAPAHPHTYPQEGRVHRDDSELPPAIGGLVRWEHEVVLDLTAHGRCHQLDVPRASSLTPPSEIAVPSVQRTGVTATFEPHRMVVEIAYEGGPSCIGSPGSGSHGPNPACYLIVPRPPEELPVAIAWRSVDCYPPRM